MLLQFAALSLYRHQLIEKQSWKHSHDKRDGLEVVAYL